MGQSSEEQGNEDIPDGGNSGGSTKAGTAEGQGEGKREESRLLRRRQSEEPGAGGRGPAGLGWAGPGGRAEWATVTPQQETLEAVFAVRLYNCAYLLHKQHCNDKENI